MAKATVYIETSPKVGRIRKGVYYYIMEYLLKGDIPFTRDGVGFDDDTTQNRLQLLAMTEALNRMNTGAEVTFITRNPHIYAVLKEKWYEEWFKETAKTLRRNGDLWEDFYKTVKTKNLTISVSDEHNTYGQIMKRKIEDMERKEKGGI